MSVNDNIQERIDKYIQGKMSEEEKLLFESDLSKDMKLKTEYESQKEIADAVQKVHLKNILMNAEEELRSSKTRKLRSIEDTETASHKIRHLNFSLKRITSLAAAIIVIVFVGFNVYRTSMVKELGNECYSQMSAPVSRSDSPIEANMLEIYKQLGSGDYSLAQQKIQVTYDMLDELKTESKSLSGEELEYITQMLSILEQDLEWYKVILNMKQGKFRTAKKQLKVIANGNGIHKHDAETLLKEKF